VNNTISGVGPGAIDVVRTTNSAVRGNDISRWHDTKPLLVVLRSVLQPLTVLWILIATALVFSLMFVRRRNAIRDPFAGQAPLASFTRGIVERESITAPNTPASRRDEVRDHAPAPDRELAELSA